MRIKIRSKILILSIALLSILTGLVLFFVHVTMESTLYDSSRHLSMLDVLTNLTMRSAFIGAVLVLLAVVFVLIACSSFVKNIRTINDSLKFLEQGRLP